MRTVRDYLEGRDEVAALVLGRRAERQSGPAGRELRRARRRLLPCPVMIIPGALNDERLEQLS